MAERLNACTIGSDGKKTWVPVKATGPDAHGLYKLVVDAEVTATIGAVNIGEAKRNGDLLVPLLDNDQGLLYVDANGHLWIAGYNLADAIMNAEDVDITYAYTLDKLTTITYFSPKWRTLLGETGLLVTEALAYDGDGNLIHSVRAIST